MSANLHANPYFVLFFRAPRRSRPVGRKACRTDFV